MLETFLNGPVAAPQHENEAYELAWRPLGARQLTLAEPTEPPQLKKKKKR